MKTKKFMVYGRVQGVSYRHYTQLKAKELGIVGYVENQSEGTVLIIAEGTEEMLTKLESWCYQGSPLAKVKKVEVEDVIEQVYTEFNIRR